MDKPVLLVLLCFLFSFQVSLAAQQEDDKTIEKIEIRGNRRVPSDTIRFHMLSQPNARFNAAVLRRDFKTVWATGFFDDLKITLDEGKSGLIVILWVKEKMLIREIKYEGLKSATQTEVLDKFKEKKVGLGIETPYDPQKIQRAITVLTELLAEKGRQYADVRYLTDDAPPNAKRITFVINEGPKVKVKKIEFHGNTIFSDRDLRGFMKYIKPTGLISTFTGKSTYDRQKLEASLELGVRAKYQENGYVRVAVQEPRVEIRDVSGFSAFSLKFKRWKVFPIPYGTWHGKRVYIDVQIDEGHQYRIGQLSFSGNTQFDTQTLSRVLGMQPGEVFNSELIRKGFENLKKIYGSRGFINWTPIPRQDIDDQEKLVNIAFDFDEGRQYTLRRLDFVGNTTTRDKVIRREMMVNEGEIYNSALFDISLLRLNQLGFFDVLKTEDAEAKPDAAQPFVDVTLKVKEKGKNSIGFTGGVSGYSGSFLGLNYATNNLFGYGETLEVSLQGGSRQSQYVFSFTEPYLKDTPVTTGFSVFHRRFSFREGDILGGLSGNVPLGNELFGQNSTGFTLFASRPVRAFTRLGLSYTVDKSSTGFASEQSEDFFRAFQFTDTFTGTNSYSGVVRSKITPSLTFSTVNNPYQATSGRSFTALMEFAGGPLGGAVSLYKPFVEAKWYKPVNNRRNVLAMRAQFSYVSGYGGVKVPIFDRMFTGGEESIRGFDWRLISPLALITQGTTSDVPSLGPSGVPSVNPEDGTVETVKKTTYNSFITQIGGDTLGLLNVEYRVPIFGPLTASPFLDVGGSWVLNKSQLQVAPSVSSNYYKLENGVFRQFHPGDSIDLVPGSGQLRASVGLEFQFVLPVINAPFRLIFGFNPLRFDETISRPEGGPDFHYRENRRDIKFSVGRTF
jgi:outer membrane protein insertion porin family